MNAYAIPGLIEKKRKRTPSPYIFPLIDPVSAQKIITSIRKNKRLVLKKVTITSHTFNDMVILASKIFDVPTDHINSKTKKRKAVEARAAIMHFIYMHGKKSYKETGLFVKRDHSTVIHNILSYQDWCDTDDIYKGKANEFEVQMAANLKLNITNELLHKN